TVPGNALSRSANNLDHENCFRLTSVCVDFNERCCSGVRAVLTASARLLSASISDFRVATSLAVVCAFALVSKVHLAMKTSATMENRVIIAVTVHGNTRLRKGLLARLPLVITTLFARLR